jgi:nitrogenase iron protein NifH
MKQIAIYGKGSIGKSTIASHLAYAIANQGLRVFQMGCDPMADSTHNLMPGLAKPILEVLAKYDYELEDIELDDIVHKSPLPFENGGSVYCAEAGGPEPGIGCGGKGVIEAINTLTHLDVFDELKPDIVIYDILGDVVCGGFSQPLRDGFAKETYLVTSGELEALYQVTNVMGALERFSQRSGAKMGGLIVNLKGMDREEEIVNDFAEKVGTQVLGINPFSQLVKECSGRAQTVFENHADSAEANRYRRLGEAVMQNDTLTVPKSMSFETLYDWWGGYVH